MGKTITSALALLIALPVAAVTSLAEETPSTAKTQLNYFIMPHPDDEFMAWSLVEKSADNYPVFILLTRGENSSYHTGAGLERQYGEVTPAPQPWGAKGSEHFKQQRVGSFHQVLDEFADIDEYLDKPALVGNFASGNGAPSRYELRVGSKSARIVFDLGDGNLTRQETIDAITFTRSLRLNGRLPELPELHVVGSAYYNTSDPHAVEYFNSDHWSVHEALWNYNFGTQGSQYGRTTTGDTDRVRTDYITSGTYNSVMNLGPGPDYYRYGIYQRVYGWLAFTGPNGTWQGGETDATTFFSRRQTFWGRY